MSFGLQWERSLDIVKYPNVWIEFTGKESKTSDKLLKYCIRDLTEEYFDDALNHMTKYYLVDEPLSKSVGRKSFKRSEKLKK